LNAICLRCYLFALDRNLRSCNLCARLSHYRVAARLDWFHSFQYGTYRITVTPETYVQVLCDVCRSIKAYGFGRMILLSGHGNKVAPRITYFHMPQDEPNSWGESDHTSGHVG
jgi:hypothetical protein